VDNGKHISISLINIFYIINFFHKANLKNRNLISDSLGYFAGNFFLIFYLGSILANFYFQFKNCNLYNYMENVIFKFLNKHNFIFYWINNLVGLF
jgi:hypothetical protein